MRLCQAAMQCDLPHNKGEAAAMTQQIDRDVFLSVRCPDCSHVMQRALNTLIVMSDLDCAVCGRTIDLRSGLYGLLIQKLAQACAEVDQTAAKPAEKGD
jgi:ribosomal protein S27E